MSNNKEIQNVVFFNKPKNILDKTRPAQIKNYIQKPIAKEEGMKEMKIIGSSFLKKKKFD